MACDLFKNSKKILLCVDRFCGYVHSEELVEGEERSKNDFIMVFFSDTGLHMMREATDLFVGEFTV